MRREILKTPLPRPPEGGMMNLTWVLKSLTPQVVRVAGVDAVSVVSRHNLEIHRADIEYQIHIRELEMIHRVSMVYAVGSVLFILGGLILVYFGKNSGGFISMGLGAMRFGVDMYRTFKQ